MNKQKCPVQYKRIIIKFQNYLHNLRATAELAKKYLTRLNIQENFSKANTRLHIAAIKWYMKHQLHIVLDLKTSYRHRPIPTILSVKEIKIIFAYLPAQYRLIFKLMYGLGMKIGEVLGLRIIDVDLNNGIINLPKKRQLKIPHIIFDELDKFYSQRYKQYRRDHRQRMCFIIDSQGELSEEFDEQPFFSSCKSTYINTQGQRGHSFIAPTTIHRQLKLIKNEEITGRHLTTMALRHSFAMEVLASGHNILELMYFLGHKDIRLTLNYLRTKPLPVRSPLDGIAFPSQQSICPVKAPSSIQSKAPSTCRSETPTVCRIKTPPPCRIKTPPPCRIKTPPPCQLKQKLNKLLQSILPEQISRISICRSSQRWMQWLEKAKNKKLSYYCYRNQSTLFWQYRVQPERVRPILIQCDYIFMDVREITRITNFRQGVYLLRECLTRAQKSLILYTANT